VDEFHKTDGVDREQRKGKKPLLPIRGSAEASRLLVRNEDNSFTEKKSDYDRVHASPWWDMEIGLARQLPVSGRGFSDTRNHGPVKLEHAPASR
jgi:hypothetical protein